MTKAEFITDIKSRLTGAGISSTFWSDTMLLRWLNQAGQRVCNWKRWPWLPLALTTTTENDREYYDYPQNTSNGRNFKEHSIYEISIEDEEKPRERVTWDELRALQTDGDESQYVFANHEGYYFLYPIPENGKEMSLYGLRKWKTLSSDSDTPITPTELDEPIIKVVLSMALKKAGKRNEANDELNEVFKWDEREQNMGMLQSVWMQSQVESAGGYAGRSPSSRW